MEEQAIAAVRSFNRTVTERIGALNDEYLGRGRPLGASRVLWEIGSDGDDVRSLRTRLGLDSGYVSRLVGLLETEGLVRTAPDSSDRRVRAVRLTAAGEKERSRLDRQSDRLATSLLEPLGVEQRARLVDAMTVVERLLTAGLVQVRAEDPAADESQHCIRSYFAELDRRFDAGFDPDQSRPADAPDFVEPRGVFLVARLRDEPIGCGSLRFHDLDPAEIKRMWVAPSARGLGVGRRLLHELERLARARGAPAVRLDTNRNLHEAIGLYRRAGFVEVEPFNDEPYAHHWFEKRLDP